MAVPEGAVVGPAELGAVVPEPVTTELMAGTEEDPLGTPVELEEPPGTETEVDPTGRTEVLVEPPGTLVTEPVVHEVVVGR